LVLGQVVEDVEVAEPIELAAQLAAAGGVVAAEPLRFGAIALVEQLARRQMQVWIDQAEELRASVASFLLGD